MEMKIYKGKVRDVYFIDDKRLLIVSTDRISAFDFILKNEILNKGKILNEISLFWFEKTKNIIKNHIISSNLKEINELTGLNFSKDYEGRTILVHRTKRIDFECIVRGYITGNGWKEYLKDQTICGIKLPEGLKEAQKLSSPIFTPTTKEDTGHDQNITFNSMAEKIGLDLANKIKEKSIELYNYVHSYMLKKEIILADTKLEFGLLNNELILIDEAFTPDSSRFWDLKSYSIGKSPDSYDKQFVRNYLLNSSWDRKSLPPVLPEEIILKTISKYEEIKKRIIK